MVGSWSWISSINVVRIASKFTLKPRLDISRDYLRFLWSFLQILKWNLKEIWIWIYAGIIREIHFKLPTNTQEKLKKYLVYFWRLRSKDTSIPKPLKFSTKIAGLLIEKMRRESPDNILKNFLEESVNKTRRADPWGNFCNSTSSFVTQLVSVYFFFCWKYTFEESMELQK